MRRPSRPGRSRRGAPGVADHVVEAALLIALREELSLAPRPVVARTLGRRPRSEAGRLEGDVEVRRRRRWRRWRWRWRRRLGRVVLVGIRLRAAAWIGEVVDEAVAVVVPAVATRGEGRRRWRRWWRRRRSGWRRRRRRAVVTGQAGVLRHGIARRGRHHCRWPSVSGPGGARNGQDGQRQNRHAAETCHVTFPLFATVLSTSPTDTGHGRARL